MNGEVRSKKQKTKNGEGEAEHEEWLQLSLSTGSIYQPPPQPESPLHAAPLQPMSPFSLQVHQETMFPVPQPHPQPPKAPVHDFSQPEQPQPPRPSPPEPPSYSSLQPMYSSSDQFHQERMFSVHPQPQPPVDRTHIPELTLPSPEGQARLSRSDRPRTRNQREGWVETIDPPYPWSTSRRARVYSIEELISKNINVISGEVHCKHCKKQYEIEYDLRRKFSEVAGYISENADSMFDRAPGDWFNPVPLECKFCGYAKCVTPVIAKKRSINWLFLFLGQMIGYCKLCHLKYFCKHAGIHRTGAKDRLLYSVYMGLCKQLDPNAPVDT